MSKSYVVLFGIIMATVLGASSWSGVMPRNNQNNMPQNNVPQNNMFHNNGGNTGWRSNNTTGFSPQENRGENSLSHGYSGDMGTASVGSQTFTQEGQHSPVSFSMPEKEGESACKNQYEKDPEYRRLVESIRQLTAQEKEYRQQVKELLTMRGAQCPRQEYNKILGESIRNRLQAGIQELQAKIKELKDEGVSAPARQAAVNNFAGAATTRGVNSFRPSAPISTFRTSH